MKARERLGEIALRTDPSIVGIVDFVNNVSTDVPRLLAAPRAVLDLHIPSESHPKMCRACGYDDVPACPTVRAITEALGADQ